MNYSTRLFALALLALVLTACPAPGGQTVNTVALEPEARTVAVGESFALDATARDAANNPVSGKTFSWRSSDPAVARVDDAGVVTGVAGGQSLITATVDGIEGSATITVTQPLSTQPLGSDDVNEALEDAVDTTAELLVTALQDDVLIALASVPPGGPLDAVEPYTATVVGLLSGTGLGGAGLGTGDFRPQNLNPFGQHHTLPRGAWTYDHDLGSWLLTDPEADELRVRYSFVDPTGLLGSAGDGVSSLAEPGDPITIIEDITIVVDLVINWWATGPSAVIRTRSGEFYEVPTGVESLVFINGELAGQISASVGWYSSAECGTIAEPTSLRLNGFVGLGFIFAFDVSYALNEGVQDTIEFATALAFGTQELLAGLTLEAGVDGELSREDCFTSGFAPAAARAALGLSAQTAAGIDSFLFTVDADNFSYGAGGALEAMDVSGRLDLNEATAVTFDGTLDDTEENVELVFADGTTMTLREYIAALESGDLLAGLGLASLR